jgi:hypothetical protein
VWAQEEILHTLPLTNDRGQIIFPAPLLSDLKPEFRNAMKARVQMA